MARPSERAFDDGLRTRIRANLATFARSSYDGSRPLRRAAVAVALVAGADGEAAFLLTRRAKGLSSHRGQWALPGGRIDGEESAADAARRELAEEVAVLARTGDVLGLLDEYPTRSGYVIVPVVVWCEGANPVANPAEVAEVHRVALADLERPEVPSVHTIPESDRPILSVPLLGTHIHAPTAAVLYQFREVGLAGRATRVAHYDQPVFAWK